MRVLLPLQPLMRFAPAPTTTTLSPSLLPRSLFGERMYQVQSLVSKSLLLWLVVGGSNQPSAYTKPA